MDKKDRSKRILSIIVPIGVLILILSFSYAYWLITDTQEDPNTVNIANCLTLTLEDVTSAISISGGIPLTNAEGMQTNPYTFKVKNTCNITITANINLEVLNTTTLDHQYARVSLQDSGITTDNSKLLTSYSPTSSTIVNATSHILRKNVEFTLLAEKEYDLRLWLDYATTWSQGNNKTLEAKIVIIAGYGDVNACPDCLNTKILTSYGGASAIEARGTPNFNSVCPVLIEYLDHENWVSSTITSFQSAWSLSPTYSFNSTTGDYTLSGTPVTGFNASHVGWYSTMGLSPSPVIYKVTGYVSGNSGTFVEKSGRDSPVLDNSCSGMYAIADDYGTSYYFRGNHDYVNNWVEFAGFYWRIIRIDGNGDIRMIYNGVATGLPKPAPQKTGADTQLAGTHRFSGVGLSGDNAYVGFRYGTPGSSTYAATHTQDNPSNAYIVLIDWYNTNIASQGTGITNKIKEDAIYCGDRNISSGTGIGGLTTYYAAHNRLVVYKTPDLSCINTVGGVVPISNDQYKTSSALITADEVVLAGGSQTTAIPANSVFWLYTNKDNWTMTPDSNNTIFDVRYSGRLGCGNAPLNSLGLRPVITLKSTVTVSSGDGSLTNPYIVE